MIASFIALTAVSGPYGGVHAEYICYQMGVATLYHTEVDFVLLQEWGNGGDFRGDTAIRFDLK